ncbi:hypothetical protein GWK47_002389 [Chionoecetes opilio]|uniref:Uncharacterized protein n=1 Tax=Chionoecetes opilio TaxID=41210 RepID=A0A8J5CE80_CHIOP|nr:hypothetical protein GWK47_002389 [Chionoecetes opilio]
MSWLLDGKGLEVLYKTHVRSSMEYACLGLGGAANKHLALLDKVQGRGEAHQRHRCRAGITTPQPPAPPRRSGPHRDVQGASPAGASPTNTPAAPTTGPGYHKDRCPSPRRATTAPLP